MTDHQHYRAPYGRTGRVPMPYDMARKIAEMSLFSRMASLMIGPRVVAALLRELDLYDNQVTGLIDMLAASGDGILEVSRARQAAQRDADVQREVAEKLGIENQRLRDRLAAVTR